MYNVSTNTEHATYECSTSDINIALHEFFQGAQHSLPTRIVDGYTGEVYVAINEEGMANHITDEWRYILIGYLAHHEMGFDITGFEEVEDDD